MPWKNSQYKPNTVDVTIPPGRANATILMLCRNSDTDNAVRSIRELEDKFNRKYHYPIVFLNEEEFSEDFKKYVGLLLPINETILSFSR